MGYTHHAGIDAALLKINGTQLTATATQLNDAINYGMQVFDVTATTAQVNAGTKVIVPGVAAKQFVPVTVAMKCTGSASGATLLRLVEETSSSVILSHVVADCTDGVWVWEAGGTVVTTLLRSPLVAAKAVLIDKTGSSLATTTAVRVIVSGFYI